MKSSRDINAKENKRTQAFELFDYLLNNFKNIKGTDTIIAKTYTILTVLYSYTKENEKVYACAKKQLNILKKLKTRYQLLEYKTIQE